MSTTIGCPIPGASQPKEPVRLINAHALKKRCVKVMFRDTPECGEFTLLELVILTLCRPSTQNPCGLLRIG
jgi:hypothetical protein